MNKKQQADARRFEREVEELANAACLALTALLKRGRAGDRALALRLDASLSRIEHTEHGSKTRG